MRIFTKVLVVLLLIALSATWVAALWNEDYVTIARHQYPQFASAIESWPRVGFLFPMLLFAFAIAESSRSHQRQHDNKVASAKKPTKALGKAEWGITDSLKGEGGIRLAFDKVTGETLRFLKRGGHGLVCGKTGSGKGIWAISAILDLAGWVSLILVDLKGNTSAVCGRYLASRGSFITCNPYEKDKGIFPMQLPKSTPYNPMALLKPGKPGFILGCERLAVVLSGDSDTSKSENSAHFKERTENLIAGVIGYVCECYPPPKRHLGTVRDILTSSNGENFWVCVADAADRGSRFVKQKLARYAERTRKGGFRARASKEVSDVLSTAERYTDFIGNEDVDPSLRVDGFRFASLKEKPGAVSLVCPLEHMHTAGGKWLRVMVASALHELLRGGRGKVPVVMFLDESDQYASPIIHASLNIARQFGVSLIIMVQQLSDIDVRYGKQAGAFLNGPSWKLFCGPTDDLKTREVIEKLCGTKTVRAESISFGENEKGTSGGIAFPEHAVPLMAGYEMGTLREDECLLKVDGLEMIAAKRMRYWECDDLAGKWDADPYEV